jgi:hypothetical protein
MQPLWPLLTSLLLLASPAARPADAPAGWQTMLDQYARLGPAERPQWIRALLGRLDRANWVVLTPGEAAGQQAHAAALLRQSAQGHTIPQAELLTLLRETDQQEKAAVERLAQRFRIRVYDTFRLQREEYARRRAAWDWVRASWEAVGSPFDQQPRLLDWLQAAIRSSTPGSVAPLPDAHSADLLTEVPRPLVIQQPPETLGQPRPPAVPPEVVRPPQPIATPPRSSPPAAELHTPHEPTPGQTQPAAPPLPLPRALPHQVPDGQPAPGRAAAGSPVTAPRRQPVELPLVSGESAPVSAPPMPLSPPEVAALLAGNGPRRAADIPPKISGQPASSLPPGDRAMTAVPPAAAAQRLSATDAPLAAASRAGQPPPRTADGPAALLPNSRGVPPAASQAGGPSRQPPSVRPPHRVNLAELATRIAGTNLALQALEAELEEDQPWDARRLGPLVDRLGRLVIRRNDLAVFYELVSPRERTRVGRLDSPQRAISRLAARIFEARTRASGPDFTGSQSQRQAELRELDELSAQLAEMASPK